jgi:hypothetical protein
MVVRDFDNIVTIDEFYSLACAPAKLPETADALSVFGSYLSMLCLRQCDTVLLAC